MQSLVYIRSQAAGICDQVLAAAGAASAAGHSTLDAQTVQADAGSLISRWEVEKGIVGATKGAYEMLVASESVAAAEVVYALHTKQIPVLISKALQDDLVTAAGEKTLTHPLLETCETLDAASLQRFFSFPRQEGRVFVVEGGDGAGKQTQVKMLCDRLNAEGKVAKTLDYPHDAARYGVLIRELLSGKMGNIKEVNPLIFAALYGLNRHDTLPVLRYWQLRGYNVVLDRYMTANFGHQASKYSTDEERIAAIDTLRKFELNWLRLPEAHRVVYLNLPAEYALQAMKKDDTRQELDMHELAGIEYKNKVRDSFVWCCGQFDTWAEVKCVDEAAKVRVSRDAIHEHIFSMLKTEFV